MPQSHPTCAMSCGLLEADAQPIRVWGAVVATPCAMPINRHWLLHFSYQKLSSLDFSPSDRSPPKFLECLMRFELSPCELHLLPPSHQPRSLITHLLKSLGTPLKLNLSKPSTIHYYKACHVPPSSPTQNPLPYFMQLIPSQNYHKKTLNKFKNPYFAMPRCAPPLYVNFSHL